MKDKNKLINLIEVAKELRDTCVTESDGKFFAWRENAIRVLANLYGKDSIEYESFQKITFNVTWAYVATQANSNKIKACAIGLEKSIELLSSFIEDMEDKDMITYDFSKVFIVHGHDGEIKESIARLIEKQGIEPIILSTKTNEGKSIIEKLEKHSDVGAAICLFTADDKGKAKLERAYKDRARQNVVFETGYFMGKLGRNRLVIISENNVELPSDMSGMVYTSKSDWKVDVLKELKAMGFAIDFNKLYEG